MFRSRENLHGVEEVASPDIARDRLETLQEVLRMWRTLGSLCERSALRTCAKLVLVLLVLLAKKISTQVA